MARALIVDDSKFMRRIIREALESGGHTIMNEAENGIEAVELYRMQRPDFVTMDITMMGQDGLKSVEEIMSFDAEARIIVVSALGEITLKNSRGFDIQVKGFLQKPFEKEQLLSLVSSIL